MALARVVTFEGVSAERMEAMQAEMEGAERPPDVPATEIVVLHDGCLVADGSPAEVMASPIVRQAYLGTAGSEHG